MCRAHSKVKQTAQRKPRGRRGWGGPWRAYVRAKSLGKPGKPDLRILGKSYNEDVASGKVDMKNLQRLGRAAAIRAQHVALTSGASAFGPKGRNLKRHKMRLLRSGLVALANSTDKDDRAISVGKSVVATGVDAAACLSLARSALRTGGSDKRKALVDRCEVLKTWGSTVGSKIVERLKEEHPWLRAYALQPLPLPKGAMVALQEPDGDEVAGVAAWASASRSSNLGACLKSSWDDMHKTLLEEDCQPCMQKPAAALGCWAAGCCICSPDGKALHQLCAALLANMKRTFPKASAKRQLLANGSIVACLRLDYSVDDYEAMLELDTPLRLMYLHIGLMYFKPFRPTMMVLEPVGNESAASSSNNRLLLKAIRACVGARFIGCQARICLFLRDVCASVSLPACLRSGRIERAPFRRQALV